MTACAPAAIALAMSPEKRMPPSEMTGTSASRSASATFPTAEICGTPTPATTRVVQMEPGPMPTLTASAPASTSARAASAVAILPAMTWISAHLALMRFTVSSTPFECPCAVSTTTRSTPASRSAATRSSVSGVVPTAAPTRNRPLPSLQARGNSWAFWKSLTVIMPTSSWAPFTTRSFSIRCLCRSASTSSSGASSRTVTRRSFGVMTVETGASKRSSKRRSRCVTIPTAFLPTTTGTPEMPRERVRSSTSRMLMSGETVIGSRMTPLSNFFTRPTSRACASMLMLLWITPMPPSWAIAMARRASVTVSMAADSRGTFRRMPRVTRVERSTSRGRISE